MESKVFISVLNWNNWKSTIQTVHSVLESNYKNFTIVILDNNSTDDSYAQLTLAFPETKVRRLNNNIGYAGAHRKSALYAIENNFELLWILNNDVYVYPETLSELIFAYQRNGESLLGSVSLEEDGETIHFGGGDELVNNSGNGKYLNYKKLEGKNYFQTPMKERPVADVEGASFMIPVSIIKKYGFIDTRYFLYGEETDYSYMLRGKYNIQTVIVPGSIIIHRASDSFKISPRLKYIKAYYVTRNTNLVCRKYVDNYTIYIAGGFSHLVKFFFKHYLLVMKKEKDDSYWMIYYTKLGFLHSLLRLKGKYLEPDHFMD